MQLHFLGKAYNPTVNTVEGEDTQETVKFLGRRYAVRRYDVAQKQSTTEELKFLGRRYRA